MAPRSALYFQPEMNEERIMDFRLVYEGPLGANGSVKEKHALRRAFHPQLAHLWGQLPLREYSQYLSPTPSNGSLSLVFRLGKFDFVPLVSERINLICHLEILLLRREEPGSVISQGGDVDNRLKTLLDALRMPRNLTELPLEETPQPGEQPFFCLLEDDRLVTRIGITTDRLLTAGHESEIFLVLHVLVRATRMSFANIGISG